MKKKTKPKARKLIKFLDVIKETLVKKNITKR